IDARIQMIAEEALRAVGRAAAVVVDPNTGNILAMASVPSFDPNAFIPSIKAKDWEALRKDEANPMVNRAVSAFPPGSTFKLVTTLAGLRKGLASKTFNCGGGVSYGDHFFHCWISEKGGSHGTLGIADAIKVSCNSFFYQMGNAAGIEAIDQTGDDLGLGKTSGIEITSESPGVLPGPDWMRIHYPRERWSQAYTANVSIGQGYDLVTPLQLAMVYATVANGGVSYYPKLVQSVTSMVDGKPILNEKGEPVVNPAPKIHRDLRFDFPAQQIQLARKGLWKVVNEEGGTGHAAHLNGVQVAGKTGTAQAMTEGKKDTIAWFACFAPFDNPKYTIVVMVQGGEHGGSVAAPIATRILERALAMDQGNFQQQVAWIAPAHKSNPFQMIPAVTFKDSGPKIDASDEENLDGSSNSDMANTTADPSVEPEADAAGKVQKKVMRPVVVATPPPRKLSFFERLFGARPKPTPVPPPPAKQPQKPVRR
ncbi:MAG: penicillin-binding protein 2, partial [Verrucomicrobiota bacterium]